MPAAHGVDPPRPLPDPQALLESAVPAAVKRIADVLHPELIILFGSYADGVPTAESDVDLLVVLDSSGSRTERYLRVVQLLHPRLFPVDLIVRTPEEISEALEQGDPFVRHILDHGRIMYEQPY